MRPRICHAANTKAMTAITYFPHDGMAPIPPTMGGGASARIPKHSATNAVSITSIYAPNLTRGNAYEGVSSIPSVMYTLRTQQQNCVPRRFMVMTMEVDQRLCLVYASRPQQFFCHSCPHNNKHSHSPLANSPTLVSLTLALILFCSFDSTCDSICLRAPSLAQT